MKKKLSKKLSLKKELVSNLNNNEQRSIKGGSGFNTCECNTDKKESCSIFLPCCIPPEKQANNG